MAGITTAAITAGTGLIGSGLQMLGANRARKNAQRALDNYERQDLVNPYKNMQISTMGSDLMREEAGRSTATALNVLGIAGDRSIIGGLGKIIASNNQANRNAALDLDRQFQQRQQAIAGGEMQLTGMREQRDNQDIAALSSQLSNAQARFDSGLMGMASSIGAGARAYGDMKHTEALETLGKSPIFGVPASVNPAVGIHQNAHNTYNPFWQTNLPN